MRDYEEIERMRNLNDSLIWDRMKMCYDYGYNRGCTDKEEEIGEIRRKEYHRGYDDGVANTPFTDTEKAEKSAYQRGLEDAWECARKITLDTGYTYAQLEEIFSDDNECNILKELSISEVMQKIKDYEERQEAEVRKAVNEGIKNISTKTGVNFYDGLQEETGTMEDLMDERCKLCAFGNGECFRDCDSNYSGFLPKHGYEAELVLLDNCENSGYYCSKCKKKLVKEGWSETVKKINFCPNCGADMRKENE